MDTLGLHLAIDGLCHEADGAAEPATVEFWSALVQRQVLRSLQSDGDDPRLNQLWATVRKDLGRAWNLDQLAARAGLGQESLRRLCQRHFGRSPFAHLTRLRMLFAADLLTCGEEKISSIATRAGYADPFAFSNAFKRELGVPPSHYRARPTAGPSVRPQPIANTPTPSAAVNRK
jgi:transcriptional regulator GlxA family with amidase domain